jgi:hypothetical protein
MTCRTWLLASALSLLAVHTALAGDRPLTGDEQAKLTAALAAEGCSGGTMEVDDDVYEVDGAKCGDGREYDLKFDKAFKLIKKEADD